MIRAQAGNLKAYLSRPEEANNSENQHEPTGEDTGEKGGGGKG